MRSSSPGESTSPSTRARTAGSACAENMVGCHILGQRSVRPAGVGEPAKLHPDALGDRVAVPRRLACFADRERQ